MTINGSVVSSSGSFESDVIVLIAKDIRRIRHFEDSEIEIVKKENLNL